MTRNVDFVESLSLVPRKRDKSFFWRDAEDRYISAHRMDGYLLISEGLKGRGYYRTPEAVKKHAGRIGIKLARYPENGLRECIECGQWAARPNTVAGRAGFCPTCWTRRKTDALREGRAEKRAAMEYEREKKLGQRKPGKQEGNQ